MQGGTHLHTVTGVDRMRAQGQAVTRSCSDRYTQYCAAAPHTQPPSVPRPHTPEQHAGEQRHGAAQRRAKATRCFVV